MPRKKKEINLKTWLVPKLRRLSYQWPPRKDTKTAARIARGQYKCASCEEIFGPKEIYLDHVEPVVDPENGFQGWDEYISRLFTKSDGFQVLCGVCHDIKTELENELRKDIKEELKKRVKEKKKLDKPEKE